MRSGSAFCAAAGARPAHAGVISRTLSRRDAAPDRATSVPAKQSAPYESTSARGRYAAYRAEQIEFYKQVVDYRTMMRVADVAAERIQSRGELALGEITMAFEVDDVIADRLRLPTFRVWSRKQGLATFGRPSCSDRAIQLALQIATADLRAPVLMLQPRTTDLWAAVCADGRRVVVVEPEADTRERILELAGMSGFADRVTTLASHESVSADAQYGSVCYSPAAIADLADWEAEAMIESLKSRTVAGGVHVIDGLLGERSVAPRAMLRHGYRDWRRTVQRGTRDWTLVAERVAVA
jgi:hypothetical protein